MFPSALSLTKQPDIASIPCGWSRGTWYGYISSHGASWAWAGLSAAAALGLRPAAWPRPPGTGCGVLFRRCPLGSSGRTGPSGRSSIGLHSAFLPEAASVIRNPCMFRREAGHSLSRGDNGPPPLKTGVPSPTPTPFFFRRRFLPASAQILLSGASPQPLTLQNKRERECLDRRLNVRSGHCVTGMGAWPPRQKGRSAGMGPRGAWRGPDTSQVPWAACPSQDGDAARAQPGGFSLRGCQGWTLRLQMKCGESLSPSLKHSRN